MDSVLKMEFPLLIDLKAEEIEFELQSEFQMPIFIIFLKIMISMN